MRFYKKGVSPLIASILLISFAVAIGTTIMSFGSTFYEEKRMISEPEMKCRYVELELNEVDQKPQICFDQEERNLEFFITNKANIDIESLVVWIIGREVFIADVEEKMAPGYLLKKRLNFDQTTYGLLKQVQFIPKVKHNEVQVTCSDKKLVVEGIGSC